MSQSHIDLALEARDSLMRDHPRTYPGIESKETVRGSIKINHIDITSPEGEKAIGKEMGTYITITLPDQWQQGENTIVEAARVVAEELSSMLPKTGAVLVIGLGNQLITPDSLGPVAMRNVIVTRHLLSEMPKEFSGFRPVCALAPGVLGITGIETAEIVKGVVQRIRPEAIVAVDALCALSTDRLCNTIQLSDTGITPGGGTFNSRAALNKETMGIPVIALGVPTVVTVSSLTQDLLNKYGYSLPESSKLEGDDLLVTPKEIDSLMTKSAKIMGYAINMALQNGMSVEEMEQFI